MMDGGFTGGVERGMRWAACKVFSHDGGFTGGVERNEWAACKVS